ncbi:MAG: hypothetical protein Hyperionvirus24_23 [Hyperionvirus sp.]|uniref:Uncharacterized protein n=1 Tax=Hyperionvirus sp. TaxID=2487770 RepID=A0A3G5ADQ5_9VIRU|nr:MAG: hypothetical protein Hyperionvirus24_23 [Hyperionvirus sp.]
MESITLKHILGKELGSHRIIVVYDNDMGTVDRLKLSYPKELRKHERIVCNVMDDKRKLNKTVSEGYENGRSYIIGVAYECYKAFHLPLDPLIRNVASCNIFMHGAPVDNVWMLKHFWNYYGGIFPYVKIFMDFFKGIVKNGVALVLLRNDSHQFTDKVKWMN